MTPSTESHRSLRRPFRTASRWLAASLGAVALAVSLTAAAADALVDSLVVRYRDGMVAAGSPLPAGLEASLQSTLGLALSVTGVTRDGALQVRLAAPANADTVRAALNRLRQDGGVLYANVAAGPAAPDTAPTNRIIVKYRNPALVANARANIALDASAVATLSAHGGTPLAWQRGTSSGANVLQLMQWTPIATVEQIADRIAQDPDVDFAEPDRIRFPTLVPTDPCYASAGNATCNGGFQWDLFDPVGGINMPAAWDITTGSSSINVAVIDTGALFNHPDLAGRFIGGYDMISDCAIANDGQPGPCTWNGSHQPDFASRDSDASDTGDWITAAESAGGLPSPPYNWFQGCPSENSSWHGSHVAGTIAATPNNGIGVAGINWVSKVVPVRVLGKCGGYNSDIADAMTWAAGGSVPGAPANANPARVLSLSLGGGGACDATSQAAITTANSLGAVVVVAAGNSNQDAANSSPGNCNGVITVAATTQFGLRARYSNYGSLVEIAAPGGNADGVQKDILSTINAGATSPTASYVYQQYAGTSMATPHVSGVASLMLSVNPALTPAQVTSKLQTTARAFPATGAACNPTPQASTCNCTTALCGSGILDAGAAVAASVASGTTTVQSSQNPSLLGTSVTFTATVVGNAPTGTVNFKDGGTTFGGCGAQPLSGSGNTKTATCVTSALALGSHSIVATYSGDGSNASSSSPTLTQVVNSGGPAPSTTTLASSMNPAPVGALVRFTATVTGTAPTGTVTLKDGTVTIPSCSAAFLTGAGNVKTASCFVFGLALGTHSIVATYNGDANNAPSSSAPLSQVIGSGGTSTTTALGSSANPSTYGAPVTVTATVTGNLPGGTVAFKDGASAIAGCTAQPLSGGGNSPKATCTTSSLSVGTHSITGAYGGDANNLASTSAPLSQVVNQASTTTTLQSSLNPSNQGQGVTFTATVNGVAPGGNVTFKDGVNTIAGCTAQALSGGGNSPQATCTTSALTVGTHSLTAVYNGDTNNLTSTSTTLSQVVNSGGGSSTTTALASSLNPANQGQSVTLTATVTGTALPTGTVAFMDGGSAIAGCTAQPLTGGGNTPTATCTTSALTAGTHSLTAVYSGDANNLTSTSATLSQVINAGPPPATVTLASSMNPTRFGFPVLLTATVTGSSPTGSVAFKDGASTIAGCGTVMLTGAGNARMAFCSALGLTRGTHSITATYGGDANNGAATSAPLSQVVQ